MSSDASSEPASRSPAASEDPFEQVSSDTQHQGDHPDSKDKDEKNAPSSSSSDAEYVAGVDDVREPVQISSTGLLGDDHPSKYLAQHDARYWRNINIKHIGITLQDKEIKTTYKGQQFKFIAAPLVVESGTSPRVTGNWEPFVLQQNRSKDRKLPEDPRHAYYQFHLSTRAYHPSSKGAVCDYEARDMVSTVREFEARCARVLLEDGKTMMGKSWTTVENAYKGDKSRGVTNLSLEDWFIETRQFIKSSFQEPMTHFDDNTMVRDTDRTSLRGSWSLGQKGSGAWATDPSTICLGQDGHVLARALKEHVCTDGWSLQMTVLTDGAGNPLDILTEQTKGMLQVPLLVPVIRWCVSNFGTYLKFEYLPMTSAIILNAVPAEISDISSFVPVKVGNFEAPPTAPSSRSQADIAYEIMNTNYTEYQRQLTWDEKKNKTVTATAPMLQQSSAPMLSYRPGSGGSSGSVSLTYQPQMQQRSQYAALMPPSSSRQEAVSSSSAQSLSRGNAASPASSASSSSALSRERMEANVTTAREQVGILNSLGRTGGTSSSSSDRERDYHGSQTSNKSTRAGPTTARPTMGTMAKTTQARPVTTTTSATAARVAAPSSKETPAASPSSVATAALSEEDRAAFSQAD